MPPLPACPLAPAQQWEEVEVGDRAQHRWGPGLCSEGCGLGGTQGQGPGRGWTGASENAPCTHLLKPGVVGTPKGPSLSPALTQVRASASPEASCPGCFPGLTPVPGLPTVPTLSSVLGSQVCFLRH